MMVGLMASMMDALKAGQTAAKMDAETADWRAVSWEDLTAG